MKIEVTLKWAGDVVDVRRLDVGTTLVIGTHPEADLCVPLPDNAMTDRTALTLASEPRTLLLGAFTLETKPATEEKRVFLAPVFDVLWANTATITMFAMSALLAIFTLVPSSLESIDDALLTTPPRYTSLILKAQPKPPPQDADARHAQVAENAAASAKADTPKPKRSRGDVDDKMQAIFGSGGIAQLLNPTGQEAMMAALGDLRGNRTAGRERGLIATGSVGVGDRGTSTVGIGRTGTVIGDRGYGDKSGMLCGGFASCKGDHELSVADRAPIVTGALDKDIIRRIVKEHEAQVRYCYEKSLQQRPGLEGKVTVRWVIAANGHVQVASADESTLHDVDAERCLTQKIRTWVFPAPRGGGVVVVNYPFVFKAG